MTQDVSTNALALERFLEDLSGKWTLLILRELFGSDSGIKRFGELRWVKDSLSSGKASICACGVVQWCYVNARTRVPK
jgi:DNA-binding HxlR family transcriptional regulator